MGSTPSNQLKQNQEDNVISSQQTREFQYQLNDEPIRIKKELDSLQIDLIMKNKQYEKLELEKSNFEKELQSTKNDLTTKINQQALLEQQKRNIDQQLQSKKSEYETLNNEKNSKEKEINEMIGQIEMQTKQNLKLQQELQLKSDKLKESQSKVTMSIQVIKQFKVIYQQIFSQLNFIIQHNNMQSNSNQEEYNEDQISNKQEQNIRQINQELNKLKDLLDEGNKQINTLDEKLNNIFNNSNLHQIINENECQQLRQILRQTIWPDNQIRSTNQTIRQKNKIKLYFQSFNDKSDQKKQMKFKNGTNAYLTNELQIVSENNQTKPFQISQSFFNSKTKIIDSTCTTKDYNSVEFLSYIQIMDIVMLSLQNSNLTQVEQYDFATKVVQSDCYLQMQKDSLKIN